MVKVNDTGKPPSREELREMITRADWWAKEAKNPVTRACAESVRNALNWAIGEYCSFPPLAAPLEWEMTVWQGEMILGEKEIPPQNCINLDILRLLEKAGYRVPKSAWARTTMTEELHELLPELRERTRPFEAAPVGEPTVDAIEQVVIEVLHRAVSEGRLHLERA